MRHEKKFQVKQNRFPHNSDRLRGTVMAQTALLHIPWGACCGYKGDENQFRSFRREQISLPNIWICQVRMESISLRSLRLLG